MRKIVKMSFLVSILISFCFLGGCSNSLNKSGKEIVSVVYKNLDTAQEEKLEEHISTIHPDSPAYASTKRIMEQMFSLYDLSYKIEDLKVLKNSGQEAEVEFVQVTKKKKGPDFRDNRVKGVHFLKKYNGEWKIYNTVINNIEYLD